PKQASSPSSLHCMTAPSNRSTACSHDCRKAWSIPACSSASRSSRYSSDSNRVQPQTRTVTCRRSASRARRREEVENAEDCAEEADQEACVSPDGIAEERKPLDVDTLGAASAWHTRLRSSARSAAVVWR